MIGSGQEARNAEPLNDDHIDKSCVLPRNASLVTPERRSKGDLRVELKCEPCSGIGKIQGDECNRCGGLGRLPPGSAVIGDEDQVRFAQANVRNILNYVREREFITDQQAHDARTFEIWKALHDSNFGLRKSSPRIGDGGDGVAEYGYVLLIRALGLRDCRVIEETIVTVATSHTCFLANKNRRVFERAFERLSSLLPPIREELAWIQKRGELTEEAVAMKFKRLLTELRK